MNLRNLIFLCTILTLVSCNKVFLTAMGMKEPKMLSEKEIQHYAEKRGVPDEYSFYADTNLLAWIVTQAGTASQRNDHAQPLQAIYFQQNNPYPISWSINCRTNPRTFRLRWNSKGELDSFPPLGNCPPDSLLTRDTLHKFMHPVNNKANLNADSSEYRIYVFYSRIFNRGSRHLIRAILENVELSEQKAAIYFVNTDRMLADMEMEE